MFEKILIAARGEIALRIIRACKELGIGTVAVHSEADKDSLHVKLADEDVCIGPAQPSESYLNIPRIISAAEVSGADAIHPGYGFLSESAEFAEICKSCRIGWIGPDSSIMEKMHDKALARKLMKEAGLPIIEGSEGVVESEEEAFEVARKIGFPVMIKASAGGGGRGIRIVRSEAELGELFATAGAEAKASFGRGAVYIEKYLENPRHIEVQIFGDGTGKVIHLGERECSVQRKHQKLIEESPSPALDDEKRKKLWALAVKGAGFIRYNSLGTMEFLADSEGHLYFLEMNTRVQVEHPVTEMVTGFDLIKEQIRLAATGESPLFSKEIKLRGHSIECRINAEDPFRNFTPSPGKVTFYHPPGGPGVRVDSHLYAGYEIPPYYDSLIAKVITWGETREEARKRMVRSLQEFVIEGIDTNIPYQLSIIQNTKFIEGTYDTSFIENFEAFSSEGENEG